MTLDNLFTLAMLIFLQAVLGFDNLLYISLESKRVAAAQRQLVRRVGIGLAIFLRIALLFGVVRAIDAFQAPFTEVHVAGVVEAAFNLHAVIVLIGGVFIVYTAFKEIAHLLTIHDIDAGGHGDVDRSPGVAIAWIVGMNLVFSFDSILSALALTKVMWVMATAIVLSGVMMMALADRVADFLERNRMYEVLGLFILLIVGVMLLSEGGHIAELRFFDYPVEPMSKTTFYFSIVVMTLVDMAQSRYQKKLNAQRAQ